jgi:hypothetical protein
MFKVSPCIRETFYNTVFTDMGSVSESNMVAIIFEMTKEGISLQKDEVLDVQYFVHRVTDEDFICQQLVSLFTGVFVFIFVWFIKSNYWRVLTMMQIMPRHILRGYMYPSMGIALYLSRDMNEPMSGQYVIHRGNLNRIVFKNVVDFCNKNHIDVGSLIVVRIEMRENCIGLFVQRIINN